jgi:dipeptidyl aminopeptidase/acylaminoacyl peptidase
MKPLCLIVFLFITTVTTASTTNSEITFKDFAADINYFAVKLSPDAKHLAVGLIHDGKRRLGIMDVNTFDIVGGLDFVGSEEVGEFYWATNKRLVIKVLKKELWEEEALYYGELYAVDFNGKNRKLIYGYRAGERQIGTKFKKNKSIRGWANIISLLPNDKKHILISSTPQSKDQGSHASVHKLNIRTGKLSNNLTVSPVPYAGFIADEEGQARIVVGTDKNGDGRIYHLAPDTKDWQEVNYDAIGNSFIALSLDKKGEGLYILDNFEQDKRGLFKIDLTTGVRKKLYTDDEVDITQVSFTVDGHSIYAARTDTDYPTYVMLNSKNEEARMYKMLLAAFPGHAVTITSKSKDNNYWVVKTTSDISMGKYYLLDKSKNDLRVLFSAMPSLKAEKLSSTQPIKFTASDGMQINGYITYPLNKAENQTVPLVTLVHGGPYGVRDYLEFDREVQMLAYQGYAVLQVNYRGSGGYGNQFLKAGYQHWGDMIQQDIIDGTRFVIEQGLVDPQRVCIMGTSFGGYSALQSTILAPDLFKCAVANAGVYDLEMMYKEGDIPERLYGKSMLQKHIGTDQALLQSFSPVNNVDKLQAPVFIAHGKQDRRVPYKQATTLKKQLDKHSKKYEWFIKDAESHGFYDEDNRAEYYEKVANFLNQHL